MSRIRLLNRKCISALIILGQLAVSITAALAQIAEPERIDRLVPNEWRAPYTQFLSGLGIKDVEKILANTKFGMIGGVHRPKSVLFRIEDKAACRDDICLTIIGHLGGERFIADALFTAGGRVSGSDYMETLLGLRAFPRVFWSSRNSVTLFETSEGWIVIPSIQ
jgi:hypothetical protein